MSSPFPGMDPYLESSNFWADFHYSVIAVMKATLNGLLPAKYEAWAEQYVWLVAPDQKKKKRIGKPDSFVVGGDESTLGGQVGTLTIEAPAYTTLPAKRKKGHRFLKIVDRSSQRVVTILELLSPSNKKPGGNHDAYLIKRNNCFLSETNLVEIDLLRTGERMPMGKPPFDSDYCVLVSSASEFPKSGVWAFSVRDELPKIPVPLRPGDKQVFLSLRDCLDRVYDENRYGRRIDYSQPPEPPLKKSDAAWARKLLKQKKIIVE